ncbi:MAG TPA: cytochrome ubiquinol oxidase subunit I, partial [Phnomibacter sp.]|nr:cytochrome ubiquinol oxidase subunit I [Phnomibacter sp.]
AILVMSVNAWYILKQKPLVIPKPAFKISLAVAMVFSLMQLFTGHKSADGVARNQPAKLAALEGHFDSSAVADMYLLGWVNKSTQTTYGLKIPGGLSFLLHQNFSTPVQGLNAFSPQDRPTQVNAIFQFYHIMVAIGMLLIGLTLYAGLQWRRGRLFQQKWLLWAFVWAVLLPQIANQAGWFAAEMGRQPWVVYGLLRTSDALSRTVQAEQVLTSLILFTLVYATLFVLFLYLLNKKIKHGPGNYHMPDDEQNESFTTRNNPLMSSPAH